MSNDDSVGYGKPPKHSQFKKGQSGNPKGRPRKAFSPDDGIDRLLDKVSTRRIGGRAIKMTDLDLMRHTVVQRALEGDAKAAIQVEKYEDRRLALRAAANPQGGVLVVYPRLETEINAPPPKPRARRRKAALDRRNTALSELASLDRLLDRKITLLVGGRNRKMTVLEAVRSVMLAKALRRDSLSVGFVESLNDKRHKRRTDPKPTTGVLVVYPRPETPEEDAALEREFYERQAKYRGNYGQLPEDET